MLQFNRKRRRILFLAAFAICSMLSANAQAKSDTPFGINFVPAHVPDSTDADSLQALLEAAAIGGHISYIWEWNTGDVGFQNAQRLTTAARALGLKVSLQLSPTAIGAPTVPADLPVASFADPDVRARYVSDCQKLAGLQPDYLILATEINLLYYENAPEFQQFATLYTEAANAVKAISPSTSIGVSYHMDMLFAYGQFHLLPQLAPWDFIGLTSYPSWLVEKGLFPSVADIPLWYYRRLRLLIAAPIVFSEIGWPSGGGSNMDDQNAFVARLPELMHDVNPLLITWAMQHDVSHFQTQYLNALQTQILLGFDVDPTQLFEELNTMGLLSWDGPPKPAWFSGLSYVTQ